MYLRFSSEVFISCFIMGGKGKGEGKGKRYEPACGGDEHAVATADHMPITDEDPEDQDYSRIMKANVKTTYVDEK